MRQLMDPRKFKVVITDYIADPPEIERRILGHLADVVAIQATDEGQLAGHVEDADALMVYHFVQLTGATMNRLQRCRLIVRCDQDVPRSKRRHRRTDDEIAVLDFQMDATRTCRREWACDNDLLDCVQGEISIVRVQPRPGDLNRILAAHPQGRPGNRPF